MGMEKNLITEKYIVSIFDLAMDNTKWFNLYQIYYWTKNSWPYDIKRNAYISKMAKNWKINFNWTDVEISNLSNILFWMNTKNNYIPSFLARGILMDIEIDNATRVQWYWEYWKEIAKWDEYSDEIRYDIWENIYDSYIKSNDINEKINIISNAIKQTNPEYNFRNKIEKEKRSYYSNLLNNQ